MNELQVLEKLGLKVQLAYRDSMQLATVFNITGSLTDMHEAKIQAVGYLTYAKAMRHALAQKTHSGDEMYGYTSNLLKVISEGVGGYLGVLPLDESLEGLHRELDVMLKTGDESEYKRVLLSIMELDEQYNLNYHHHLGIIDLLVSYTEELIEEL